MNFIAKTPSPFLHFSRQQWASLRQTEPMTLTPQEIITLKGANEDLSLEEVEHIYLPLSRLLNLQIASKSSHQNVLSHFLDRPHNKIPYIIGITGSVAVGKSTTARLLQALLSRWPEHRRVSLVTTDGFLYPNSVLQANQLMGKKGFPESYNTRSLLEFIMDIKMGKSMVKAPIYSHFDYDIIPNKFQCVDMPDVLILEGLNILQLQTRSNELSPLFFLSDFIDFSIYVDASVNLLETWYVSRFLKFRESAFKNPNAYFHEYAKLDEIAATKVAHKIWHDVNLKNLKENILPTRERADLVMIKDELHTVNRINLRK